MIKEQQIINSRYIEQEIKIDNYSDRAVAELIKSYNLARKKTLVDINKAIKNKGSLRSKARLEALLKEIDERILHLTDKITKPAAEAVGLAGEYSYKDTTAILSWDGRVEGFNNVGLTSTAISNLALTQEVGGKVLTDWMWSSLNSENSALKSEIMAGRARGIGYKQIVSEMGSRYDNLLGGTKVKQDLETVARSYIATANAKAHKDTYEANRSVLKEVEWSAIMENGNADTGRGTCPRCMALDGKKFPTVAQGPPCPLHPRCRCMYLPVTKTWKELGFGDDIPEMNKQYKKWYDRDQAKQYYQSGPNKGKLKPPSRIVERLGWKNLSDDQQRLALLSTGFTEKDYGDFWGTRTTPGLKGSKIPSTYQANAIGWNRAWLVLNTDLKFNDIVDKNGNLKLVKDLKKDLNVEIIPRK